MTVIIYVVNGRYHSCEGLFMHYTVCSALRWRSGIRFLLCEMGAMGAAENDHEKFSLHGLLG